MINAPRSAPAMHPLAIDNSAVSNPPYVPTTTARLQHPRINLPNPPPAIHPLQNKMTATDDVTAIRALLQTYTTALHSRSVPAAVSLYMHDGVFMAPGHAAAAGTEALQAAYTRVFAGGRLEVGFEFNEVVVMAEGWAFARTEARGRKVVLENREGGGGGEREVGEVEAANQELFVLRKREEGWRIARYAFSSMRPML